MKFIKKNDYKISEKEFRTYNTYFTPISKKEAVITLKKGNHFVLLHIKKNDTHLYPVDEFYRFIKHPKGLLAFTKDNDLVWFKEQDFSNPIKIKVINRIKARIWKTNVGEKIVMATPSNLGISNTNSIPINIYYPSYRSNRQLSFLKIDFENRKASILIEAHNRFITLNKYDVLKSGNYALENLDKDRMFSEKKLDDGTLDNYYNHHSQMLFQNTLLKDKALFFFSPGTSTNYNRYGMNYVLLGNLKKEMLSKKYKLNEILFFQDENYMEAGKNGKTARFTSSMKYCILYPYFKTSDPWKYREKLYDIDNKKLIDITLPRGFKDHHLMDHYLDDFWAFGRNSERKYVITRFELENNQGVV